MKNSIVKYIIYILITVALISSCVSPNNYKYLSFFFDGVPDPSVKDNLENNIRDSANKIVIVDKMNTKPQVYKHIPYAENECNSCHDKNKMGTYINPQPALCYQCHIDFNEKYDFLHGPVFGGYCSTCHDPHKSKFASLLVKDRQDLCFNCHDQKSVNQNDFHNMSDEQNCITCHNPHGGANRKFMAVGSCQSCHGDFKDEYNYLHGPVAGGHCNTCHDTHNSKANKLLTRSGQALCTYCHDINLVLKNENHEGIEEFECTECHNAHGGEDRFIFN
jgi:predicted CXXCH cytochrome family protein